MKGNVFNFRQESEGFAVSFRQYQQLRESFSDIGVKSLSAFECVANQRHDGLVEKMSIADREKIACALFLEIKRLESNADFCSRPFSKRALAIQAGLAVESDPTPTKRLYELTVDPMDILCRRVKTLCAKYDGYKRLIYAIFEFSRESREDVCKRIFLGTSFEGGEVDVNKLRVMDSKIKKSISMVDGVLRSVNGDVGIEQVFDDAARRKSSAHEQGSLVNWPFFDSDDGVCVDGESFARWSYWPDDCSEFGFSDVVELRFGLFWSLPFDWYAAVSYLPRVYLGCAVYLPEWGVNPNEDTEKINDILCEVDGSRKEIAELRFLSEGMPRVVWCDWANGSFRSLPMPVNYERFHFIEGEGHCWLTIYPDPTGRGVCPLLYWSQGEGGVHVCVVSSESMHLLSKLIVTSVGVDNKVLSVFDRLCEVVENNELTVGWIRTVFDLLKNPVFQLSSRE